MKIFEPVLFDNIRLKNRFIRSATSERKATIDGHMSDELTLIYKELAQNDIGLIITGYAYTMPEGIVKSHMMGIYDDTFIKEYRDLTELVHSYNTRIIMQLVHGGSASDNGYKVIGPSSLPHVKSGIIPEEASIHELQKVTQSFIESAIRVYRSGFDGVQIHAAHGYLISQFLDPRMNKRKDAYGGNIHHRAKLLYDIVSGIRENTPRSFHVSVKLHCYDSKEGGMCFDESMQVCEHLSNIGVNSIEISGGDYATQKGECFYASQASIIAKTVSCPVFVVGGNRSLHEMNNIVEHTNVAAVSLCRAFICEPDLVLKFKGQKALKAKCIRCAQCFQKGNCIMNNNQR